MKTYPILIALILILASSCSSEKRMVNRYYLIEMPSAALQVREDGNGPHLDGSCEISGVDVAPAYERNQIVNRSGSNEISFYRYNLWAVRPSVSIRELILSDIEASGMFSSVSERFSLSIPDYLFSTRIDQLEVLEDRNNFSAHLSLRFTLLKNDSRDLVLSHEADRTVPLEEKDLNLFAAAVSSIILEELRTFQMKLAEHIVQQDL